MLAPTKPYRRVWQLAGSPLPRTAELLPTSFRIFKAGLNATTKGTINFDASAARTVMEEYEAHGVADLPIDLEHESLGTPTRPDSADARGWFRLELRNGELWATHVRWTSDGARRLSEKTQRFISPAVVVDVDGRPIELINVALVSLPATRGAPALVAASRRLSPEGSSVLSARVTPQERDNFRRWARKLNTTESDALRRLVALTTSLAPTDEDSEALAKLIALLGLPEDADRAALIEAIDKLLTPEPAPKGDGLGDTASTPAEYELSANERASAQRLRMTPEQVERFTKLCAQRQRERAEQSRKKAR